MKATRTASYIILLAVVLVLSLVFKTCYDLQSFSDLGLARAKITNLQVVDRNNIPLSVSYQNRWNSYDYLPLHSIPPLLSQAFIVSEDQHFYQHHGIDWQARGMAFWNVLRHQKVSRGASTLSEQVVRMLHPRPRTLWSKWMESVEVMRLEHQFSKPEILEFYLNEVPYAANRRGVFQAAQYYFNRDLSTLSDKEMLALIVLARAPSSYDLYKNPSKIDAGILRLAMRLQKLNRLNSATLAQIQQEKFALKSPEQPVNAAHFVSYVRNQSPQLLDMSTKKIHTTLDSHLQKTVQELVDQRVKSLLSKGVHNAGALVVDHQTGEVMAWVVAGANRDPKTLIVPSDKIDSVTTLRQPGSALKPFLYTLALELGWTPATIIEDSPLAEVIDHGYHQFENYSHRHYGDVTLRQALGNSLNIPAIRTIKHTGVARYLETLHTLGFNSLKQRHEFYDEGLALGNGEVSLFELVQAYTALAHHGQFRPLKYIMGSDTRYEPRRVFSDEATSLIANILSDPRARQLEFGAHSILNLPVQTAVKTGTSSDYHDAWVVGYNYRYVVGIWMGNLDHNPTDGVTGALGPALTLRSIFAELTKNQKTQPLFLSPRLIKAEVCDNQKPQPCVTYSEYFMDLPTTSSRVVEKKQPTYKIIMPTPDLRVALDPRVSADKQQLPLQINMIYPGDSIEWFINGTLIAKTKTNKLLWRLSEGKYTLTVIVHHQQGTKTFLSPVSFTVK
jgi:penicillin-binding protein 1C